MGAIEPGGYEVSFGDDDLAPVCALTVAGQGWAEVEAPCPFEAWARDGELIAAREGQDLTAAHVVSADADGEVVVDAVVPLDVEWLEVCGARCREAYGELLLASGAPS